MKERFGAVGPEATLLSSPPLSLSFSRVVRSASCTLATNDGLVIGKQLLIVAPEKQNLLTERFASSFAVLSRKFSLPLAIVAEICLCRE